jgi:hypothetical protein
MSLRKSRNAFSDEDPITDPEVYRQAFEQIEKEIFTRNAMNATAPALAATPTGAPMPTAPAPAAGTATQTAPVPAPAPPAQAPTQPH